jgi:CBS domain-containing protein
MMLDATFEGIYVHDVMTPIDELAAVPPDFTLDRLFYQMLRDRHTILAVVNKKNNPVGIVSLTDVRQDDRMTTQL